jgi:hypothetical protein
MDAPVKFKLDEPTENTEDWRKVAPLWHSLNATVQGNPAFSALTIKGAYAVGLIYGICQSVSCLLRVPDALREITYIPAYGVFASGIELLGRCVNGNSSNQGSTRDIKKGFKYLVTSSPDTLQDDYVLVRTSTGQYTIDELTSLRHFAAHGQATSQFVIFDRELLAAMPPLLADGLERWWNALQGDEDLCNRLARANILALRNVPVFTSWALFERDGTGVYNSITTIFNRFKWSV